jgi:Ni/Co efflux regulator RcnB
MQENAGNEPSSSAIGSSGWSSGGGGDGSSSRSDALHHVESNVPSSSLVEKANWAGHARPSLQAPQAPWEQPRALNLREFPSLAAAAAVSQSSSHSHRGSAPVPTAESGAWDEDERAGPHRTLTGSHGRHAPGYGREPPHEDGYGYSKGPPPYFPRQRADYLPAQHRRYSGEESQYSRYGGPPRGYHGGGGHGGWRDRDDRPQHDRCDCCVCCTASEIAPDLSLACPQQMQCTLLYCSDACTSSGRLLSRRFDGLPRFARHGPPPPQEYGGPYDRHSDKDGAHGDPRWDVGPLLGVASPGIESEPLSWQVHLPAPRSRLAMG